jgi:hypothetical protein
MGESERGRVGAKEIKERMEIIEDIKGRREIRGTRVETSCREASPHIK